jgi:hypothetical protein
MWHVGDMGRRQELRLCEFQACLAAVMMFLDEHIGECMLQQRQCYYCLTDLLLLLLLLLLQASAAAA